MGAPKEPKPVKLFVGLLVNEEALLSSVGTDLMGLFGPVELKSENLAWTLTDYYREEMGPALWRKFVAFAPLISPETLAEIKLKTQRLEEKYVWVRGDKRGRCVNIDPGYLDVGKVVLASTKYAAHRIYLRSGIYAEVTVIYRDGAFHPLAHTYADYFWPETLAFFAELRSLYLDELRQHAQFRSY